MEKVLWEGRRSVKSFYDMILCGSLLIVVSAAAPLSLSLPGIEIFALAGMLAGASLLLLAFFLSLSYRYMVTEDSLRKEYYFFAWLREEVPLESVTDVVVFQDLAGRALGFGTVRADTAGTAYMGISFVGVEDPYGCAEAIRRAAGKARGKAEKHEPIVKEEIERMIHEAVEKKMGEVKGEIAHLLKRFSSNPRSHVSSLDRNGRVVYIPMQPIYDFVLDRLRGSPDEPFRETVKRVFRFAAEHLGWN